MDTLDTVLVVVLAIMGLLGFYWGCIRQVLSITGLLAGIVLANRYSANVADMLSSFIASDVVTQVAGFLMVMIAVSATASLCATIVRRSLGLLFLGWLDHLIGGVLGLVQGALICTVIMIVISFAPATSFNRSLADSYVAPLLVRGSSLALMPFLPESFQSAAQRLLGSL